MMWSFPIVAGAVALVQMTFLPGHTVMQALRVRRPLIETLLLSFALSALLNFWGVWILVALGVYTKNVLWALIGIEAAIWSVLSWRNMQDEKAPSLDTRNQDFVGDAIASWRGLRRAEQVVVLIAIALGLYALIGTYHFAFEQGFDGAFVIWDAVFSWNNWAGQWARNIPPGGTYHYPQLMPANVSIFYALIKSHTMEFVGKFYVSLFPAGIFLMLLDVALRRRQPGYSLAAFIAYYALWKIVPPDPASGHADVPVTFFSMMTVYILLNAQMNTDARWDRIYMIFGAAVAAAAFLTKQMGFVIVLAYPVLVWGMLLRNRGLPRRRQIRSLAFLFFISAALSLPWYAYTQLKIYRGIERSETAFIAAANAGPTLSSHLLSALALLVHAYTRTSLVLSGLFIALAVARDKSLRWILLLLFLPALFIWASLTSYDTRNGTLAIVCGCVGVGVGINVLWNLIRRCWSKWPDTLQYAALIAFAMLAVITTSFLPSLSAQNLTERQDTAKREAGDPPFNRHLYDLLHSKKLTHFLLSNYHIMNFLPELKPHYHYDNFEDIAATARAIDTYQPDYIAVMKEPKPLPAVGGEELQAHEMNGTWSVIAEGSLYYLIQRHNPPLPPEMRDFHFGVFREIAGLGTLEGPYPQWNMPIVRWGLGPETKIEFHAETARTKSLHLECMALGNGFSTQKLTIVLNGKPIATREVSNAQMPATLIFDLPATPGENEISIQYDKSDTVTSPGRALALLYTDITLIDKSPP